MKQLHVSLLIVFVTLLVASCKKPDVDERIPSGTTSYSGQTSITYRVSSATIDSLVSISYDNETGGLTLVDNPKLPFTKKITKAVNKYDVITLGYFVNPAQTVKLEILVNDKVVKSEVHTAPNSAMSYTF